MLTIWSTWWCHQEFLPCQAKWPIGHLVFLLIYIHMIEVQTEQDLKAQVVV